MLNLNFQDSRRINALGGHVRPVRGGHDYSARGRLCHARRVLFGCFVQCRRHVVSDEENGADEAGRGKGQDGLEEN